MERGGSRNGAGRRPSYIAHRDWDLFDKDERLAEKETRALWMFARVQAIRRDEWCRRQNLDIPETADFNKEKTTVVEGKERKSIGGVSGFTILAWQQYADETPEIRNNIIRQVAREASAKFKTRITWHTIKRVLYEMGSDV